MSQHYKALALLGSVLLLGGCATSPDRLDYLVNWDQQWQQCDAEMKNSNALFPSSKWFQSLKIDEQKHVLVYLHNLKLYECSEFEAESLKRVLDSEEIVSLQNLLQGFIFFEPPSKESVESLDQIELEQLAKEVQLFDLRKAAEQLGYL